MSRSSFLAAVFAIAFASGVAADEVVSAPRTLDVVVTDKSGNHIPGLTRSDFQILEDGKDVSIERFAELKSADAQPPRSFLIMVDQTSISLSARRMTIAALRSFAASHLRPIDRVMVLTINGVGNLTQTTHWTSSKDEILKALDQAEQSSTGNKNFEKREAERHIQLAVDFDRQAAQDARSSRTGTAHSMITFDTLMQSGRQYADSIRQQTLATAEAINQSFGFMGIGAGKKIAIIAGGGLSTRPGTELFQYLETTRQQVMSSGSNTETLTRGAQTANPLGELARFEVAREVRQIAESARDHGISVYTIDSDNSGSSEDAIERSASSDISEDFLGQADKMSGYQILTKTTGGTSLLGNGGASIGDIINDLDAHYMLSYTQTLNAKGNLPKLDVRMTKPGLHIRYGYTGGPATKDAEIQEAVVANHTAAQLANDLRISLANETPVADGESRRVRLHVMIPVKSLKLVQEGTDVTGGFAIYVSMGDGKGNASQVNRQTHEIRWPAEKLPSLIEKSIGFNVDVVLLPGRNQVSVGVMDERSKTMGFAKAAI